MNAEYAAVEAFDPNEQDLARSRIVLEGLRLRGPRQLHTLRRRTPNREFQFMFGQGITGAQLIFILTIGLSLIGLFGAPQLIARCLFRPYWFLRKRQYDRILVSGFVHADLWHLLFNMVTFYFFGFQLERRIGTTSFVVLYVLGLILSECGTYLKHRNNADYATLGASGAISAVLFAYIVYYPTSSVAFLLIPIPIPAPLFAVGYLAYSYWSARQERGRINHDAHFAGALTGLGYVAVAEPEAYRRLFEMLS